MAAATITRLRNLLMEKNVEPTKNIANPAIPAMNAPLLSESITVTQLIAAASMRTGLRLRA